MPRHRRAQPLDPIGHRDAFRRRDLGDSRLDRAPRRSQTPASGAAVSLAAPQRAGQDRQRTERRQPRGDRDRLTLPDLVETWIGVGVPARGGSTVANEVQPGHSNNQPGRSPGSAPFSMNHSVPNALRERLVGHLQEEARVGDLAAVGAQRLALGVEVAP